MLRLNSFLLNFPYYKIINLKFASNLNMVKLY